jgi:DnaJ-class molecular chaperone
MSSSGCSSCYDGYYTKNAEFNINLSKENLIYGNEGHQKQNYKPGNVCFYNIRNDTNSEYKFYNKYDLLINVKITENNLLNGNCISYKHIDNNIYYIKTKITKKINYHWIFENKGLFISNDKRGDLHILFNIIIDENKENNLDVNPLDVYLLKRFKL